MKTTAYWLTICAIALAIAALWLYNGQAQADSYSYVAASTGTDTVVKSTILDNTEYPKIVAQLDCSGTDINDMVGQCSAALRELCPDGGEVQAMGETPAGVLPAKIRLLIACKHEPGA
jgi:hypothetical protein